MTHTTQAHLRTRGNGDTHDLTALLEEAIADSGLHDGIATVFVVGSTAGITTVEFEPGLVSDIATAMERVAPTAATYEHEQRWHDDNGHSHVRASLLGPSVSVPFVAGRSCLGTWQQVVLIDFDTRPRERIVVVQLLGE